MRRPHVLSSLVVDHPSRHDERRGVAGIDEDPDKEVNEERHDSEFRGHEIALEPCVHEGNDGKHEHDARRTTGLTLIQDANRVVRVVFTKFKCISHD